MCPLLTAEGASPSSFRRPSSTTFAATGSTPCTRFRVPTTRTAFNIMGPAQLVVDPPCVSARPAVRRGAIAVLGADAGEPKTISSTSTSTPACSRARPVTAIRLRTTPCGTRCDDAAGRGGWLGVVGVGRDAVRRRRAALRAGSRAVRAGARRRDGRDARARRAWTPARRRMRTRSDRAASCASLRARDRARSGSRDAGRGGAPGRRARHHQCVVGAEPGRGPAGRARAIPWS